MRSSPLTYALLISNILIFGLQTQVRDGLMRTFALWPLGAGFEPWQIVSSAFLHGSTLHLAANMFGLWMFGRDVEQAVGSSRFAWLYAASVLTASLAQLVVTSAAGEAVPTVGASGGLFGLLAAFAMLFPKRKLIFLLFPMPLPAPVFVSIYAAFELYSGIQGTMSGVAHFAHLGGLVGGILVLLHWRRQARGGASGPR